MNDSLNEMERVFLALSDKTRIRLVDLMRDSEVSVNYLCETLGISQPKVSRHLAYLRTMGMVQTRRDGKWIYYSLSEPESRLGSQLLRDAISWARSITSGGKSLPPRQNRQIFAPETETAEEVVDDNIYGKPDINGTPKELEVYLL